MKYEAALRSVHAFWTLFESTGWNDEYRLTEEEFEAALRASRFVVAAYDGDRLTGFGRVVADGRIHAMVYDLITDREYRGRGIGSEMLRRLVEACREAGIRDIQLFCARGAREFYEKRGFRARTEDAPGMEYAGAK